MNGDYQNFVERMGSFEDSLDLMNPNNTEQGLGNNELYHHGVLGMKWGHRIAKNPQQAQIALGASSKFIKESKNINNAAYNIRSTHKRKDLRTMSDEELKKEVNRMNLEQQYSSLSSNKISKGQAYARNTMDVAGAALAIASSGLGIALAIKQLKG